MSANPMMKVRARRFVSPFTSAFAKLEPINQPLYSCYIFDAATAPSEALFFQYANGGQVATNQTSIPLATLLHTNLPAPGFLPAPKIFLATGLRVIPVELSGTLINPLDDTAAASSAAVTLTGADSNLLEDLLRIVYGSVFTFFVGTKNYFQGPTWFVPANTGTLGYVSNVIANGATPTNTLNRQTIGSWHSAGKYNALDPYQVLIPSQQNFQCTLTFPQSTKPTIGATRPVYTVLDGVLGRETQ